MAFIQVKKCLSEPRQLIKLIVLLVCVCITIYQLSECVKKLLYPPVSTYYKFHLNETIKYPSLTVCRRPAYKTILFPLFGVKESAKLTYEKTFINFPFENHSIEEFLNKTTYSLEQTAIYGFGGSGLSSNVAKRSTFLLQKGACHTFTPQINSDKFTIAGGYFLYFKHSAKNIERDLYGLSTSGFEIYLHSDNEVLTGEDEQENSFMEYLYLESSEDMHVNLKLQTFSQIATAQEPCNSDPHYSKSKCQENCFHRQIADKAGCTLPWLRVPPENYTQCQDYQSVKTLITGFNSLNRSNYLQNCDCKISCNISVYSSHIESRREADTLTKPGSTINIYFSSNLITQMEEVIGYDWNVFLSDIGGSMGFLLGLSVIGIITVIEDVIHLIFRRKKGGSKEEKNAAIGGDGIKDKMIDENSLKNIAEFLADCDYYEKFGKVDGDKATIKY